MFVEAGGILYKLGGYIGNYDYQDDERSYEVSYDDMKQNAQLTIKLSMEDYDGVVLGKEISYTLSLGTNSIWQVQGDFKLLIKSLISNADN